MLEKTLEYPKFKEVSKWLDRVLPKEKRVIPLKKKIDEAMVLAAGRGIRMRELTNDRPKPLIEVCGKALIDYNFDRLRGAGIKKAAVNLCYCGEQIKEHLQKNETDFEVKYFVESEALETGGGIKNALSYFKNEAFFVCNSDVFFEEEKIKPALWRMMDAWDEKKFDVLLLLQDINAIVGDKGLGDYKIERGCPVRNKEKEEGFDYMFAGIYIIKKSIFDEIKEKKFSSVKLCDLAQSRGRLGFIVNKSIFYHIGTPEALKAAEEKVQAK